MTDSLTIHYTKETHPDKSLPDPHQDTFSRVYLGFWTYLMTDCIIFATLFVTHAVLNQNTFGGPNGKDLFSLPLAFSETMILLFSSFTCGLAVLAANKNHLKFAIFWLLVTIALGLSFLGLELHEFAGLIEGGNSFKESAFLSSFFVLVGTHGLHISFGLLWATTLVCQLFYWKLTVDTFRRLMIFSLFWHFLDVIWIFIFTFVYLMGVL